MLLGPSSGIISPKQWEKPSANEILNSHFWPGDETLLPIFARERTEVERNARKFQFSLEKWRILGKIGLLVPARLQLQAGWKEQHEEVVFSRFAAQRDRSGCIFTICSTERSPRLCLLEVAHGYEPLHPPGGSDRKSAALMCKDVKWVIKRRKTANIYSSELLQARLSGRSDAPGR